MNTDYTKYMAKVRENESIIERMNRVCKMFKELTNEELRKEHVRLVFLAIKVPAEMINIEDTARFFYLKDELISRGFMTEDEDMIELMMNS